MTHSDYMYIMGAENFFFCDDILVLTLTSVEFHEMLRRPTS